MGKDGARAASKASGPAGYLVRQCPELFRGPLEIAVYVLLAGTLEKSGTPRTWDLSQLARWTQRSKRAVQLALNYLTLSGPLPLLLHTPGKPGRSGSYAFVRDPFAVAYQQHQDAKAASSRRQPGILQAQIAAFKADNDARAIRAGRRRTWNVATREISPVALAELQKLYGTPERPEVAAGTAAVASLRSALSQGYYQASYAASSRPS